jgi:leader peptidase (prepilin peptidase)/N-methyltransferase
MSDWQHGLWWQLGLALLMGVLVGQMMNRVVDSLPQSLKSQGETTLPSVFSSQALRQRVPLAQMASALIAVLVVARFGLHGATLWALVFSWALLALSFIDLETHLLPDALTLPLLWGGLVVNSLGLGFARPEDAILGSVLGYGLLWGVNALYRMRAHCSGMGGGDFKMMAALGATLGWQALPLVILMASLLGILSALPMALKNRSLSLQQRLPFGPFLALAGIGGILSS